MTPFRLPAGFLICSLVNAVSAQGLHWTSAPISADDQNKNAIYSLAYVWIGFLGALLAYRCATVCTRLARKRACADSNHRQDLYSRPNIFYALLKKHLLSAPLFSKRHSRKIVISKRFDVGILPTRFETVLMACYFGVNVILCTVYIDYSQSIKATSSVVRNRTGVMAVLNMIPLFVFAGRNNPLIRLCGISFGAFNTFHRFCGRLVVIEALAHGLSWIIGDGLSYGWTKVDQIIGESQLILTGFIGMIAMVAILLQSHVLFRHAFYETFIHVHQVLVIVVIAVIWIHLKANHPLKSVLIASLALWLADRLSRLANIVYRNYGTTQATVEPLAGDAVRLTLHLPRPLPPRQGQYAFLYLPALGFWMSHPFSIASVGSSAQSTKAVPTPSSASGFKPAHSVDDEKDISSANRPGQATKLPVRPSMSSTGTTGSLSTLLRPDRNTVSLIIRCRGGFTKRLHAHASDLTRASGTPLKALIEGPYNAEDFSSYGTALLFAAGVGITHTLPHARALVLGASSHKTATRRVMLCWIVQSTEHIEWIADWLADILTFPAAPDVLCVRIFVTRNEPSPVERKESVVPCITNHHQCVTVYEQKPDISLILDEEMLKAIGAVVVNVCGTGELADDLRYGSRSWMTRRSVDLVESSFTW